MTLGLEQIKEKLQFQTRVGTLHVSLQRNANSVQDWACSIA